MKHGLSPCLHLLANNGRAPEGAKAPTGAWTLPGLAGKARPNKDDGQQAVTSV